MATFKKIDGGDLYVKVDGPESGGCLVWVIAMLVFGAASVAVAMM